MSAPDLLFAPRVGLYGGTFDPIHAGHLFAARQAQTGAALDGVVFVPAHRSPHKARAAETSNCDRSDLIDAAIVGDAGLARWGFELERGGVSYTIDTVLEAMRLRGRGAEPVALVIGSDNLAALERWRRVEELLQLVRPIVVPREPQSAVARRVERLAPFLSRAAHARLASGVLDVHETHPAEATQLREELARGTCPPGWLPPAVHALIEERELYRAPLR